MSKTLILYYSATGTTKRVAQKLAQALDADLAEIHPAKPYTSADLDWHDQQSRTSVEQHQSQSRVDVVDDFPDLAGYDTVIIGHPTWWGIPPRMIASVIDDLDLNGKTLASFATSGGSGYDRSQSFIDRTVQENGYQVNRIPGAVLNNDRDIQQWLADSQLGGGQN